MTITYSPSDIEVLIVRDLKQRFNINAVRNAVSLKATVKETRNYKGRVVHRYADVDNVTLFLSAPTP